MYDGTIGALFDEIRELLYHERIPYAQLASPSAMSTVDTWFDAQEDAHDFAKRVAIWVRLTSIEHSSDSLSLETLFRLHMPLPGFKSDNAPALEFGLSAEQQGHA